jgi:MoaA/NifB/PqqE/SkfB family radical SAM enzyme
LDLTNTCNHACPGCSFSYLINTSKDQIPHELACEVIGEMAEMGVKAVTFSGGGEPLVYGVDKVLGLMELVRRLGMDCALITNGSFLVNPVFLDLCTWIRVSLDAYDADTFGRFHGRSDKEFCKVVSNIRTMASHPRSGTLGVGFLTDHGTLERRDYWQMAQFCSGLGVDYLQFRPLVVNMVDDPTLKGGGAFLTEKQMSDHTEAFGKARAAWSKPGYRVMWSGDKYAALAQPEFGRTYTSCHAHFLEAVISADSKVYACCHGQGIEKYCLGDLRELTFERIWRSDKARQVMAGINPKTDCPPACRLHPQNTILQTLVEPITHPNFI